jgi:hypothetical protein
MLFATALTNESIADALAMPAYRPLYIALAREILAVAAAAPFARGVRRFRSRGIPHQRTRRRGGALARRAGRAQPALGQVAQRHLARPRGAKRPTGSRRAARHRRHARGRGRSADYRSPRCLVTLDPRDRAGGTRPQSLDTLDALCVPLVVRLSSNKDWSLWRSALALRRRPSQG